MTADAVTTNDNHTTALLATGEVTHTIIRGQYDWCGGATLTTARFTCWGQPFVARRFWRADIGCAGIELYTIDPTDGMEDPIRGTYCDHQTNLAARRAKFLIATGMAAVAGHRPIEIT